MRYDEFTVGYRNEDLGAAMRLEGLLEQRDTEVREITSELGGLHARRVARAAAGAAMILGFIVMVGESLRTFLATRTLEHALPLLLTSWGAGALVYVVTFATVLHRFPDGLRAAVDLGHGPRVDMERIEAAAPKQEARAQIDRWERDSIALPMTGVTLLAPLTLHWLFCLVCAPIIGGAAIKTADFGAWMAISLLIVGHCHLVLVYLVHRFARTLRGLSADQIAARRHGGWAAFGWTVASTIPVAIIYLIPTVLVAVTGVMFIPAMFALMQRRILAERALLAD